MSTIRDLEARRNAILEEMRSLRSMRRGTISEQYLKVHHKGKKDPVIRGPYFLFSRKEKRRTVGYRLTTPEELEQARKDVAAHKRFVVLCEEFEQLTERLGEPERQSDEVGQGKKRLKLRSNRMKK